MSVVSKLNNFDFSQFFSRFYKRIFKEDILSSAAQVAFYFTFALFPLLLFLLSLFGLVLNSTDEIRKELFYYLAQIMPNSAYTLVNTTIQEVTKNSSGGKLTIGFLIALWSASAGVSSIIVALNSVYNLRERRSWWKTKLISLLITLAASILIMIALGIVLYGTQLINYLFTTVGAPLPPKIVLTIIQIIIILIVLIFTFGLIYNFCPSYKKMRWVWISPGAITGIVLWLLLSAAFRVYLQYFDSYAKTYGSLGAVIILLLWLYLTAVVILVGGLINSIFENMAKHNELSDDKTEEKKRESENNSDKKQKTAQSDTKKNNPKENSDKEIVKKSPEQVKVMSSENNLSNENNSEVSNKAEKAFLGLVVGTLFGVLFGMIFSKKNDKNQ